jgi:predicted transcriptional regulator
MTKTIKLSVNLSTDVVDTIRRLAEKRHVTMTEVIRDAVGTEKFLEDARGHSRFLLEDERGEIREVVFH